MPFTRRVGGSVWKTTVFALTVGVFWGCATGTANQAEVASTEEEAAADGGIVVESVTVPTQDLHVYDTGAAPSSDEGDSREAAASPGASADAANAEYRIGPGDVLKFQSFDDESLSDSLSVRYDGYISLPLIPDLHVENKSRAEATELVREAYSEVFVEPLISLSIVAVGSKSYFVMGDVNSPAEYPYRRYITLLDAINLAGGPRIDLRAGDSAVGGQGQLTEVLIIRHVDGQRQVMTYDLSGLTQAGPHPSDTPVFPGDIVYLPEGVNLVYLLGEVRVPDVYELTEGMTLLQLLVLAGGPIERTARMRQVVLMHRISDEETVVELISLRKMLNTGRDWPLRAGDVVYVPQKRVTRLSDFVAQFAGTISPILSLYTQAFDAWHTNNQWDLVVQNSEISRSGSLAPDQFIRDVTQLLRSGTELVLPSTD